VEINPEMVGNDYLVMGTLDKKDWRKTSKQEVQPVETLGMMYFFKNVLKFELAPMGWCPDEKRDL
ncbi:MAG: hypothetical protein D3922_01290, partial [Candidatus Electrothrix sp. AR1]|nr:hypothetical protein [Candidatus Electrothrix sp. AR1]